MNLAADLSLKAWLDEDGHHVWIVHDCVNGPDSTMLPYPQWGAATDGLVSPSIICDFCGLHSFARIAPQR